ncbi:hypothetical protein AYI70_g11834 [Smittium culicis]|uniref:Uncharacterized protein n=1 Tax=Smittium culicis TaxID=133412 RepID=A0A1R1X035_9FUNG|nr:hypothetical protein AYI70_g11834 [Smittium culicis]
MNLACYCVDTKVYNGSSNFAFYQSFFNANSTTIPKINGQDNRCGKNERVCLSNISEDAEKSYIRIKSHYHTLHGILLQIKDKYCDSSEFKQEKKQSSYSCKLNKSRKRKILESISYVYSGLYQDYALLKIHQENIIKMSQDFENMSLYTNLPKYNEYSNIVEYQQYVDDLKNELKGVFNAIKAFDENQICEKYNFMRDDREESESEKEIKLKDKINKFKSHLINDYSVCIPREHYVYISSKYRSLCDAEEKFNDLATGFIQKFLDFYDKIEADKHKEFEKINS